MAQIKDPNQGDLDPGREERRKGERMGGRERAREGKKGKEWKGDHES